MHNARAVEGGERGERLAHQPANVRVGERRPPADGGAGEHAGQVAALRQRSHQVHVDALTDAAVGRRGGHVDQTQQVGVRHGTEDTDLPQQLPDSGGRGANFRHFFNRHPPRGPAAAAAAAAATNAAAAAVGRSHKDGA